MGNDAVLLMEILYHGVVGRQVVAVGGHVGWRQADAKFSGAAIFVCLGCLKMKTKFFLNGMFVRDCQTTS